MVGYARLPERRGPLGVALLAVLAGLPLTFGALAVGRPEAGTVPFVLAAWLQVLRMLVMDFGAEAEHRAAGRRTLAVRLGHSRAAIVATVVALGFIPVSFLLPARAGFGGGYFLVALFVALAVLVTAARVIVGRVGGSNVLLKGAMVMGAMALVVGRVT
jgi:4-hydroxybenzoate polyprenyltransferase